MSLRWMRQSVVLAAVVTWSAACASHPNNPNGPSGGNSPSLQITGLATYSRLGIRALYTATEVFPDQSTKDVTSQTTFSIDRPWIISMTSSGQGTSIAGNGSATISATYQGVTGQLPVSVVFPGEDCIAYDPSALQILATSGAFDVVAPFGTGLEFFFAGDTMTDATNIVALMRRTTSTCYVGRNNGRANRLAYISHYFKGPSGQTTSISPEDCQSYNTGSLQVVVQGSDGWSLTDGTNQLLLLDTQSDANTMLGVAQQASMECFIGRGNMRPDPLGFIVQYWR